ncbi:lipoate--protein ligase family protein [Staphylospora marina]|uniref:lipoate--protein ligase family protein n=1 Tax=Staphylospora marina TaxID=2490858 RepID=UPI000F5BEEDC|nr:biotin/lipoate A/B protein ligase family protein [Staphylospora marina]
MQSWRFLPYRVHTPAENMAIDEAILHVHREGRVPPTVRFYGWNPATLSIGYFQRVDKEVVLERIRSRGLGFVRRMTGGRAVLHDKELTYSVVVSEDHPLMPPTVSESYRVISQALLEGYRLLGLKAELSLPESGRREAASAACFDSPSDYELVIEGRKAAGSAQTRQRGVILQHGSVLVDLDEDLLFDVLRFPNEQVKERLKRSFSEKAVAINQLRSPGASMEEVIKAFFEGFERGMGIRLEPGELTEEEREVADRLVREKYGTDDWNRKK